MNQPRNTDQFIPESYYHVYNHAVGNENLFRNRGNYLYFLSKFKEYVTAVCRCYAYCLMPNHFHFLIKIRTEEELKLFQQHYKPGVSIEDINYHKVVMNQISRLLNGYAQAYNRMFERKGALFLDYTRRREIVFDRYFNNLIRYIHYNPVHHSFCKDIRDWEFSSFVSLCGNKVTGLERSDILKVFGSKDNFIDFHIKNQYRTGVEQNYELL